MVKVTESWEGKNAKENQEGVLIVKEKNGERGVETRVMKSSCVKRQGEESLTACNERRDQQRENLCKMVKKQR